jgi:hypothetical protein
MYKIVPSYHLQHGLDLCRLLELGTSLGSNLVNSDTVCELNERQTLGEVDVKHALPGR